MSCNINSFYKTLQRIIKSCGNFKVGYNITFNENKFLCLSTWTIASGGL
jgi:hypothetical protein